ncbi:MAG: hypothetical protein KKE50_01115 [Nanoarchaeota archaeon]|nr:hypothetical protein [Nanoarchaeota archaeon]
MELLTKNKECIISRAPRLDTVLMVEEFIEKNSGEYTQIELFRNLPKKMMWNTFRIILAYLEKNNKIIINKDGTITWIWNPKLVEKYLKRKDLEVKIK